MAMRTCMLAGVFLVAAVPGLGAQTWTPRAILVPAADVGPGLTRTVSRVAPEAVINCDGHRLPAGEPKAAAAAGAYSRSSVVAFSETVARYSSAARAQHEYATRYAPVPACTRFTFRDITLTGLREVARPTIGDQAVIFDAVAWSGGTRRPAQFMIIQRGDALIQNVAWGRGRIDAADQSWLERLGGQEMELLTKARQ